MRIRHEGCCPERDGAGALAVVGEDVADQRHRRRHNARARNSQERPSRDQRVRVGGKGGDQGGERENGAADQQDPLAANPVGEVAHRNHQARDRERVDVADPQQLFSGWGEVAGE